jgi:hypothetical protein
LPRDDTTPPVMNTYDVIDRPLRIWEITKGQNKKHKNGGKTGHFALFFQPLRYPVDG